jgi:subtilase family serine protease
MTQRTTVRKQARSGHARVTLAVAIGAAAALGAVAAAGAPAAGAITPAHRPAARTVVPATTPDNPLPPNVKAVCAWPPPSGHAACLALVRTDIATQTGVLTSTDPPGLGPADLRSAYKLTQASAQDGSAETVALVDAYNDPHAGSDLAVYRAQYGLPACTTANGCFRKVNQSGQSKDYPPGDPGWSLEMSLDIDMVSAICPLCHILLVEATSQSPTDLGTAADEAVTLGAKFESNSYGFPEWSGETSFDHYYDHPGVAVTAASGDYGYGTIWPSASRYVTAVGGTSLLRASNPRGWDEIAWSGTGSGCSPVEVKPSWQHDSGCGNRTVADVAAVADPDEGGVAVYDTYYGTGGWWVVGGTSVASPLVASVYALAGTPKAATYPAEYPYANHAGLFDIVAGTNSFTGCSPTYLCTAGPGYDGPTGWGTPDGPGAFNLRGRPPTG